MAEPFLGEIKLLPYNFAPKGWAFCNGQILPINQNTALFSLLGTQYGGNGQTTFALPDLRGRVPIHQGQGPGLSSYTIGQVAGYRDVDACSSPTCPPTTTRCRQERTPRPRTRPTAIRASPPAGRPTRTPRRAR